MGDILKAIHDDMEEYEDLCQKYGEEVQSTPTSQGVYLPDCYGNHARQLKERARKDNQIRNEALLKLSDEEKRVLGLS